MNLAETPPLSVVRQLWAGPDNGHIGPGPHVERDAIDLAGRVHPRSNGQSPVFLGETNPARQGLALSQDQVEERETLRREVQQDPSRRHADSLLAEGGDKRRVAVDDQVTGSAAHTGWSPRGGILGRGRIDTRILSGIYGRIRNGIRNRGGLIGVSHAVDCAPSAQLRRTPTPRSTRPVPGRPDRSRWRRRSGPGPDREDRSVLG